MRSLFAQQYFPSDPSCVRAGHHRTDWINDEGTSPISETGIAAAADAHAASEKLQNTYANLLMDGSLGWEIGRVNANSSTRRNVMVNLPSQCRAGGGLSLLVCCSFSFFRPTEGEAGERFFLIPKMGEYTRVRSQYLAQAVPLWRRGEARSVLFATSR
jgi:hypothetical protein